MNSINVSLLQFKGTSKGTSSDEKSVEEKATEKATSSKLEVTIGFYHHHEHDSQLTFTI